MRLRSIDYLIFAGGLIVGLLIGRLITPAILSIPNRPVPALEFADLPREFVEWSHNEASKVGFNLTDDEHAAQHQVVAAMYRARVLPTADDISLILMGMSDERQQVARWSIVAASEIVYRRPKQLTPTDRDALLGAIVMWMESDHPVLQQTATSALAQAQAPLSD